MNREIIDSVRCYPILWDKTHIDYFRNIPAKNEIWTHLASKLGMNKDHFKRRWNSMRDQHYKALKDAKNGRTTHYKYGKLLSFINGNVSPSYTNNHEENNINDNENIVSGEGFTWDIVNQSGDDQSLKIGTDSTFDSFNGPTSDQIDNSQSCSSQNYLLAEEKVKIEDANNLSSTTKDATDMEKQDMLNILNGCKESPTSGDKNSPVMLFMMSLAAQIERANLSPKSFVNLQIKLLQAVSEEID